VDLHDLGDARAHNVNADRDGDMTKKTRPCGGAWEHGGVGRGLSIEVRETQTVAPRHYTCRHDGGVNYALRFCSARTATLPAHGRSPRPLLPRA